ncbi:MAG: potassium channel family protein [Actinomycetota bacterium]
MAQARRPPRLAGQGRGLDHRLRNLRFVALFALVTLVAGTIGYIVIEGWTPLEAFYMTITTLTTVGFAEVRPLGTGGRLLTIGLIFTGVAGVFTTIGLLATAMQEGVLGEGGRRRRMQRRIDHMRNHIIVCGYGRVGRTVVEELKRDDVTFLVIDQSETRERQLMDDGLTYLIGDATRREDLMTAGIDRARALISVVDDDAENIFITMVARSMSASVWIVARAEQEESIDRLHTAGASRVFSPFVTAGREMAYSAINPRVVDFFEVETGAMALRLEELRVDAGSNLVGKTLADVRGDARALAVAHANGQVVTPPDENLRLEEGDVLVVLGQRNELKVLEQQ